MRPLPPTEKSVSAGDWAGIAVAFITVTTAVYGGVRVARRSLYRLLVRWHRKFGDIAYSEELEVIAEARERFSQLEAVTTANSERLAALSASLAPLHDIQRDVEHLKRESGETNEGVKSMSKDLYVALGELRAQRNHDSLHGGMQP